MTASRANLLKQYKDTDKLQSNPVNMDSSGNRGGGGGLGGGWGGVVRVKGSVRTRRVEYRENARAFFHQGQRHRSVIIPVLSGF